MTTVTWEEWLLDLEIIGSTVVVAAADLPIRLNPIFRRRGEDDVYYVQVEEGGDAPPVCNPEPRAWLEEQTAAGEIVRFETALPARRDHVLIQFAPDGAPEYLPEQEIPDRVVQARAEALLAAAEAMTRGDRAQAEAHVRYAARAEADDPPRSPLPQLLRVALGRGSLGEEDLALLEDKVRRFSRESIRQAVEHLARQPALRALSDLIQADPLFDWIVPPHYLRSQGSSFSLSRGRQSWGADRGLRWPVRDTRGAASGTEKAP